MEALSFYQTQLTVSHANLSFLIGYLWNQFVKTCFQICNAIILNLLNF